MDGFRKTDIGTDLIAKDFRGSIQNTRLFSKLSSFTFCSIIYLFEKRKGVYSCLPSKDSLNYSFFFIQRMVSLTVILVSTKCFLFVYMYIDLLVLKLKAYKLFKNSEPDLSWLFFFFFKEANLFKLVINLTHSLTTRISSRHLRKSFWKTGNKEYGIIFDTRSIESHDVLLFSYVNCVLNTNPLPRNPDF